jgi:hypothetical protein
LEESELPDPAAALDVLESLHKYIVFKDPASARDPILPPKARENQIDFFKTNKIVLCQRDFMTKTGNGLPVPPRPEQLEGLLSLATVGHVRAYRKPTPLEFATKDYFVRENLLTILVNLIITS